MLRSLLAAAAALTAVVVVGFAVQAATFGRPSGASLRLLRTVDALVRYHLSRATIELHGKHFTTVCSGHWPPHRQVADVMLNDSAVISELGHRLAYAGPLVQAQFDLAGCPRPLRLWLSNQLARGAAVELKPAIADGVRVFAVRLPSATPRLELFIARSSGLPVKLALNGKRMRGASDISYGAAR